MRMRTYVNLGVFIAATIAVAALQGFRASPAEAVYFVPGTCGTSCMSMRATLGYYPIVPFFPLPIWPQPFPYWTTGQYLYPRTPGVWNGGFIPGAGNVDPATIAILNASGPRSHGAF